MTFIQECASRTEWQEVFVKSSSGPGGYTVSLPPWDRDLDEVVCECPSYEFRGWCKHQEVALARVCHWIEGDGSHQTPQQRAHSVCPHCNGPTVTVEVE